MMMNEALAAGNELIFVGVIVMLVLITLIVANRALNEIMGNLFASDANRWQSATLRLVQLFDGYLSFMTAGVDWTKKPKLTYDFISDIFKTGPVFRGKNKYRIFAKLGLLYLLVSLFAVYMTFPVKPEVWPPVAYEYTDRGVALALVLLLVVVNIVTDMLSIAFTFRNLQILRRHANDGRKLRCLFVVIIDAGMAAACFVLSQLTSNFLYPLPLRDGQGVVGPNASTVFSYETPMLPYAIAGAQGVGEFVFSGQLLLTGTVFLPTIVLAILLFAAIFVGIASTATWKVISFLRSLAFGAERDFEGVHANANAILCQSNIAKVINALAIGMSGSYLVMLAHKAEMLPGLN